MKAKTNMITKVQLNLTTESSAHCIENFALRSISERLDITSRIDIST